ncbi:uncharacterized protein LAESUDRAFT_718637, partial [Laetiporus sulphureus 93-53]
MRARARRQRHVRLLESWTIQGSPTLRGYPFFIDDSDSCSRIVMNDRACSSSSPTPLVLPTRKQIFLDGAGPNAVTAAWRSRRSRSDAHPLRDQTFTSTSEDLSMSAIMPRSKSARPLPTEERPAMGRQLRSSRLGAPAKSTVPHSTPANAEIVGKNAEGFIRKNVRQTRMSSKKMASLVSEMRVPTLDDAATVVRPKRQRQSRKAK